MASYTSTYPGIIPHLTLRKPIAFKVKWKWSDWHWQEAISFFSINTHMSWLWTLGAPILHRYIINTVWKRISLWSKKWDTLLTRHYNISTNYKQKNTLVTLKYYTVSVGHHNDQMPTKFLIILIIRRCEDKIIAPEINMICWTLSPVMRKKMK